MMLFSAQENANIGVIGQGGSDMVDLEFDGGLAVLTIDRPHARNAISLDTMEQLEKALDAAAGAQTLVITGSGDRAFVSGGDLKELSALRTEEDAAAMAKRMRTICDQLASFPAPVIAALNGHAFGGGAEVRRRRRHPGGRRRHQNRLQPGGARNHAGLGRCRAAGRAGREGQGAALGGHRRSARRR